MKRFGLFLLIILGSSMSSFSQYSAFKEIDSLEFSTKWVREKWYKKNSPLVLAIKVTNKSSQDCTYTLGIEFFQQGVLIESSPELSYEIRRKSTRRGKLNGIIFKPEKLSSQDIRSGNFTLELSGLDVAPKAKTTDS